MSLLLKNVLHGGTRKDISIEKGRFVSIKDSDGGCDSPVAERCIDASGLAIFPAFFNAHTHAAMTLLRGYADDMPLQQWLQDYIWPYEDKLSDADIAAGSRLAVEEMVSGGSCFFNDMYFGIEQTIKAVCDAGMRACIGITVMECHSQAVEDVKREFVEQFRDPSGGLIQLAIAPHAIYTVGKEKLRRSAEWARKYGLRLHIHLSETDREVQDCLREHAMTPVRYLDSIGFLGPDVVAAHCVHVDEEEWDILAERGVTAVHCPCSNMTLGSGRFPYELALKSGAKVALGTDGASSNNNLDMREEMKFAALLAKCVSAPSAEALVNEGVPTLLPASVVLEWATRNGAQAFGLDSGEIAEGKLADCVLVDLSSPRMRPGHNALSDWVYSASAQDVAFTLCNGRVIYARPDYSGASI